jgi:phosphatidylinositol glycan class V
MLFYVIIVLSPFILFQAFAYDQFCHLHKRPWCSNSLPLVYSFVQKEYWNNGFLEYYQIKQAPNFLLAFPWLYISFRGLYAYISADSKRFLSLGLLNKSENKKAVFSDKLLPFMYLWTFCLFLVSFFMHIQVILRFFTFLPPLYWTLGLYLKDCLKENSHFHSSWLIWYLIFYPLIGVVLFSNFLPPA